MLGERATWALAAARGMRRGILLAAASLLAAPSLLADAARFEAYRDGAVALREAAVSRGWVSYDEVVALSYGPGGLDPEILQAKADWRSERGGDRRFITTYEGLNKRVKVFAIEPIRNVALNSHFVGLYFPRGNVIKLASTADPFVILHESGHALQRAALKQRRIDASGNAAWSSLAWSADLKALDERALGRLRYLTSQDEFEVRLQDLNRFYAVAVAGKPILDERDAAQALLALRLPLEFEELREAMSELGPTLERAEFDAMVARSEAARTATAPAFDDARELAMLRQLAIELDASIWPALLQKILVEAPGHY